MAHPTWGYDRFQWASANLGHDISDQTVGNILAAHGMVPAPAQATDVLKDVPEGPRRVETSMVVKSAASTTSKVAEELRNGSAQRPRADTASEITRASIIRSWIRETKSGKRPEIFTVATVSVECCHTMTGVTC